jgi:hypothetical protein
LESRYIVFDLETREIKGIMRNRPSISENFIDVPYSEVEDFINGKLNSVNFFIDRTADGKFYLAKKTINMLVNSIDERLYKIQSSSNSPDLIVENHKKTQNLVIYLNQKFREYLLEKHGINSDAQLENLNIQGTAVLEFLLCYKDDPHNRITYTMIPLVQLLKNEKLTVKYETEKYDNHCVFTRRVYNDYKYVEVNE